MGDSDRAVEARHVHATHEVFNQTPPLRDYNAWLGDTALREVVARHGAGWAEERLTEYGAITGSEQLVELGFRANANPPVFHSHDRHGRRVDRVDYDPAYHELMSLALEEGIHSSPWTDPGPGAHVARAAKSYLQTQVEAGHGCPLTMTFAAVPTLRVAPQLAADWLPKVLACEYDSRDVPYFEKRAVTLGMGMTEKQGGSDVRANTSVALPLGSAGDAAAYELTGHKWFLSAPMCDAFLMLAQAPDGLTCFLVPRHRPDGSKNPFEVQRLKNKMGNVSNASSEVEMRGALGWRIGDEGRGVTAIIEMVALTRFDCMAGSAAGQRQAVAHAVHHANHRRAFGKRLIEQPLMRNVLADLQLEVEGSLALTMRIGEALDHVENERERLLVRLGTAVGKYWICKRTPGHAYEAMECLGGNGVTEEFITARLYREAPINAIWEGSGNIQALDVLRAMTRDPEVVEAWLGELRETEGERTALDQAVHDLERELADRSQAEFRARRLIELLALTMQASLLVRAGNGAVAEAFVASRLGSGKLGVYGTLPPRLEIGELLRRGDPLHD